MMPQPPPIPPLDIRELKPAPCPCGANEYREEYYVEYAVHRFRPDLEFRLRKVRDICATCGEVRRPKNA